MVYAVNICKGFINLNACYCNIWVQGLIDIHLNWLKSSNVSSINDIKRDRLSVNSIISGLQLVEAVVVLMVTRDYNWFASFSRYLFWYWFVIHLMMKRKRNSDFWNGF